MSSLIAPLLWAVVVGVTLWPRMVGRRLGFAVYVLTMAVNELPLVFLLIISSGIWVGIDDRPAGLFGVVWIAAWGATVVGLIWAQIRAGRARPALDGAFAQALGGDWRAVLDARRSGRPRRSRPWLTGIACPFQRRRRGVERIRDLTYGPDPAHRLDLYRATSNGTGRPILIHFHEGGFVQGGRSRESVTMLNQLAAHGWVCISADYRLRQAAAWPNPLVDAKRAIAWAREHASEYGADPGRVHLAGGSAGGHLALDAALTCAQPRFQPGFEAADTSVASVVSLYGYLGGRDEALASSLGRLARRDTPPLLLIHGANDTGLGVPLATVRGWARALRSASDAPVVYAELPGAQHAFDLFASVRARMTADAVEDFLTWTRSAGRHGTAR